MKRKKIILLALLLILAIPNSFAQAYQIFVRQSESMPRYADSVTTLTLDCDSSDGIEQLKQRINEKLSLVPVGNLMLIFAGTILEDARTLADYGIQKESTVHVYAINLYPATSVEVGGTASVLSVAAPGADYTNKTVSTTPDFTGSLSILPTGEISIVNASPAGTYEIQIYNNVVIDNVNYSSLFQKFNVTVYNSSYTVLFNANSGTGTMAVQPIDANTAANLITNTFTRTGYAFAGWNTAANGSGTSYANGSSYTMSAAPNVTLYAQWIAINYTVTFAANGGTGTMSNQTLAFNASANLTSNAFTRWGYTFTGWNGNNTSYADQASLTMSAAANVTLQAQWQPIQSPGGANQIFVRQSDSMPRYVGGIGTTITMDVDNDNTIGQIRQYLADLTLVPFENLGLFFSGLILEDSRTLAYYNIQKESTIHVYAVHLYPNTSVITGDTASVLSVAAPGDNYFSKTLSTTPDFTGSLSILPTGEISIQNASPAGTYEIQIYNNIVIDNVNYSSLFQKFNVTVKNNYTVTFDVNGGLGSMVTQTITSGSSANLRTNAITRTGYTFVGWATTSGGTVAYDNSANYTMGDADVSLYAKWTIADSQSFCKGVTVAAAGSGLKFYTALTGGSPLAETTALVTKNYFVIETINNVVSNPRVPVAITVNALPATPTTLVLTNVNSATPDIVIKKVGVYVGAEVALKLTATAVGATSYVWTLPAGVTLADGFTTGTVTSELNTINVMFSASAATASLVVSVKSVNASGCSSSAAKTLTLTRAIPVAPVTLKMNNGLNTTAITSFAKYMGTGTILRLTAAASATATSYVWELPEGVTRVNGLYDYNTIYSNESTVPEIFVTLTGVTNANTLTAAETNVLRIGVYGKNGTGLSATVNATLANPATSSTARLLTLTAVKPAAPATLKMYDLAVSATAAVRAITNYVNTETELKLEAKASALASSYTWVLSEGVNVTNGSADAVQGLSNTYTSTSNAITVNFYGVPHESEAFSLVLGVRAVNGIGESVKVNVGSQSTATLLTLTAVPPAAVGAVVGSLKICATTASSVTYTIATVAKNALNYFIQAPDGCTITLVDPISGPYTYDINYLLIPAVTNASFTVNYPAEFIITTTNPKSLRIVSINRVGYIEKSLTLTNTGAVCTPAPGRIAAEATTADKFSAVAYPNPSAEGFRVKSSNGKSIGVQVYDMLGRSIEQRQLQSDTQIGSNYAKGVYNVIVSHGTEVKTLRVIKQ